MIAGISDGELFQPKSLNLLPVGNCTACWRGYRALYTILDSRLVLDELNINLGNEYGDYLEILGPPINGVDPVEFPGKMKLFRSAYFGLQLPIKYTGGVLIAREFIESLYVHQGFHPAWKYRSVIELLFNDGSLENAMDRSERMEEIRNQLIDPTVDGGDLRKMTASDFDRFVERSLGRHYRM